MKPDISARLVRLTGVTLVAGLLMNGAISAVVAEDAFDIAQDEFAMVWNRTEAPVADGAVSRSWLWGPEPRTTGLQERYLDSPGQERTVQYFDKGRMEINDPTANPSDPWFVTSGLLTRELISGKIQVGDDEFLDTGEGSRVHVAGDPQSPFPQYRHLAPIIDQGHADRTGESADTVLTPGGIDPAASGYPVNGDSEFVQHITYHGPDGFDVGYNIPRAFWEYLNAPGLVYEQGGGTTTANPLFSWIFVMGFPIADPFWVEVNVDRVRQWVLIQPFERRVLTYTPGNPAAWQVEMGNIGQHYRDWRSAYFHPANGRGDAEFFGFPTEATWRYNTSYNVDEVWYTAGTDNSFVPGSNLYVRDERKLEGRRYSYWSMDDQGLFLHGWDMRDGRDNIRSMVVYSPAIHVLPTVQADMVLSTEVTAISLTNGPVTETINVTVGPTQYVSTRAGVFRTWRMESTGFSVSEIDHRLGHTFWFEPEIGIIQWLEDGFSAHLIMSSLLDDD